MPVYSHSRISTFEQCPFKFKLRYIDEIIPEVEQTIESHLGRSVHKVLEWLYTEVTKKRVVPTISQIIDKYTDEWTKEFSDSIRIIKNNFEAKDYFNKGVKFLIDYYFKYKPFDDGTIETEKRIFVSLDKEGKYKIQGFIDRLVKNPRTGEYEIHDYKTANSLPSREKIESDRQLAIYSIAIKELFKTNANINLVWHYLAHNTKIVSKRTSEQLEQLRRETIDLIQQIESAKEFPTYTSVLCDWCEYKSMCPAFGGSPNERQTKIEHHLKKPENELEQGIKDESEKPEGLNIWG